MTHQRGQGLLEVTVAVGVAAALIAAIAGLQSAGSAGNAAAASRVQAGYLAAEGLEVIREWRDSNVLNGKDWWEGLTNIQNDGTLAAAYDPNANAWTLQFNGADNITDASAAFTVVGSMWVQGETYAAKPATGFARLITLYPLCAPVPGNLTERLISPGAQCPAGETIVGVEIVSAVRWAAGRKTNDLALTTRLYGWQ